MTAWQKTTEGRRTKHPRVPHPQARPIKGGPVISGSDAARIRQLFSLLAGRIARVARRLAFGLERYFFCGGLFLFARELGCGGCRRRFFAAFLLGLGGFARQFGLGPLGGLRLALGLPLHHSRVVLTRLTAKLVQHVLLGLLRRFLPICEARFLESTHCRGLVAFILCCEVVDLAVATAPIKGALHDQKRCTAGRARKPSNISP